MLLPIVLHLAALAPHALVAVMQTGGAPVYTAGKFTVIDGVFCPVVMVVPTGVVHVYPVAPVTAGTENTTPVAPGHTLDGAVIAPGTAGVLFISWHLAALVDEPPHGSCAVTHKFPDVNPVGKLTCTFCVPCPLVIAAPDPANVQLYWVAPPDTPQL
jgi:hypothetical protein